jgi:hypothetical protein
MELKMAQYLITYSRPTNDQSIFGFKICDSKQANLYMHCVNLLIQENVSWNYDENQLPYENDDFEVTKLTTPEMKTLCRIFDMDYLNESNIVGTFPDAINDAYEYNLIDEDENDISDLEENM